MVASQIRIASNPGGKIDPRSSVPKKRCASMQSVFGPLDRVSFLLCFKICVQSKFYVLRFVYKRNYFCLCQNCSV